MVRRASITARSRDVVRRVELTVFPAALLQVVSTTERKARRETTYAKAWRVSKPPGFSRSGRATLRTTRLANQHAFKHMVYSYATCSRCLDVLLPVGQAFSTHQETPSKTISEWDKRRNPSLITFSHSAPFDTIRETFVRWRVSQSFFWTRGHPKLSFFVVSANLKPSHDPPLPGLENTYRESFQFVQIARLPPMTT